MMYNIWVAEKSFDDIRRGVDSIEEANATHYKVGKAVRETIKGLGTTLPEDLPLPEKSIQELQREQLKQIKDEKSSINVSHDKV